jgi:hypothetical protein
MAKEGLRSFKRGSGKTRAPNMSMGYLHAYQRVILTYSKDKKMLAE